MSLRLDALRRGKKTNEPTRPTASRVSHADAVLASLGYPKQPRRSGVSGQAIAIIATAALLAGVGAWQGAVWLTAPIRPTASPVAARTAAPQRTSAPQPAAPAEPPPRFIPAPEPSSVPSRDVGEVARQAAEPPRSALAPETVEPDAEPMTSSPIDDDPRGTVVRSPTPRPAQPAPRMARSEPAPVVPLRESTSAPVPQDPPVVGRPAPPPRFIPASSASAASLPPSQGAPVEPANPVPRPVPTPSQSGVVNTRPPLAGVSENDYFRLALYYQQTGDFENALVQYKKVLEKNEMNAEAHNNLGVLYQNKGLSDEAIREFRRAVSIDPKYGKGHNNLGVALLRSGQVDAAASEFRWLLDADKKNVDALINLGLALKAGNRTIEAREYLLRALLVKNTHPAVHYNLALVYEEDDELVKAIEHYEKFLQFAGAEHATITKDVRSKVGNLRARLVDSRGR